MSINANIPETIARVEQLEGLLSNPPQYLIDEFRNRIDLWTFPFRNLPVRRVRFGNGLTHHPPVHSKLLCIVRATIVAQSMESSPLRSAPRLRICKRTTPSA